MGDFFHSYVSFSHFFFLLSPFPFLISHFSFLIFLKIFWRFEINIVFLRQDKGGALIASFSVKIDIVQIISENE